MCSQSRIKLRKPRHISSFLTPAVCLAASRASIYTRPWRVYTHSNYFTSGTKIAAARDIRLLCLLLRETTRWFSHSTALASGLSRRRFCSFSSCHFVYSARFRGRTSDIPFLVDIISRLRLNRGGRVGKPLKCIFGDKGVFEKRKFVLRCE